MSYQILGVLAEPRVGLPEPKAFLQKQMEDLTRDALQHPEAQAQQQAKSEALKKEYVAKFGQTDLDAFIQQLAQKLFSGQLGDFSMSYQGGLDGKGETRLNTKVVSTPAGKSWLTRDIIGPVPGWGVLAGAALAGYFAWRHA